LDSSARQTQDQYHVSALETGNVKPRTPSWVRRWQIGSPGKRHCLGTKPMPCLRHSDLSFSTQQFVLGFLIPSLRDSWAG